MSSSSVSSHTRATDRPSRSVGVQSPTAYSGPSSDEHAVTAPSPRPTAMIVPAIRRHRSVARYMRAEPSQPVDAAVDRPRATRWASRGASIEPCPTSRRSPLRTSTPLRGHARQMAGRRCRRGRDGCDGVRGLPQRPVVICSRHGRSSAVRRRHDALGRRPLLRRRVRVLRRRRRRRVRLRRRRVRPSSTSPAGRHPLRSTATRATSAARCASSG